MASDVKMESTHLVRITDLLKDSQWELCKDYFLNPDVQEWALKSPTEVVSTLAQFIIPPGNSEQASVCRWMLMHMAVAVPDPEDIFLELLNYMEAQDNDPLFVTMLQCAETSLWRMTSNRSRSLDWCLMTIKDSLSHMDFDQTERIEALYNEVQKFYTTCIDNLQEIDIDLDLKKQKQHLSVFLMSQLVYTSLPEPFTVKMIKGLAKVLPHLGFPLIYLGGKSTWKRHRFDSYHYMENISSYSFEMFHYYVLHKRICYEQFPQIFSPEFIFVHISALSSQLLMSADPLLYIKGLELLSYVLQRVVPEGVSHHALSANHFPNLLQGLANIMVYCSSPETRKSASQMLKCLIFSFDERGRHLILYHGTRVVANDGVRGYMLTFVKEFVMQYINSGGFFMQHFPALVLRIFVLPQGDKTLVFQNNETLISLLNLLRYMTAIDSSMGPKSGFLNKTEIAERFMKPLNASLQYSTDNLGQRLRDAEVFAGAENPGAPVQLEENLVPTPVYEEEVASTRLKITHIEFVRHVFDIVNEKF